jgi:hypothetical protein
MDKLARLGLLALLAACGGSPADPAATDPAAADSADPTSDPALIEPLIEPLRLRNEINRELDVQRAAARHREALFDQAVGPR